MSCAFLKNLSAGVLIFQEHSAIVTALAKGSWQGSRAWSLPVGAAASAPRFCCVSCGAATPLCQVEGQARCPVSADSSSRVSRALRCSLSARALIFHTWS